jgi:formamidopyrimidine-DNA glycosylase
VRRFGRLAVAEEGHYVGTLAVQGPDALDPRLTAVDFWRALKRSRRAIKTQLLSQRPIAGVGNIYADEALYYAHLHPERRADTLDDVEVAGLHAAIVKVLRMGIEREGASIDRYVKPDGTKGDMQNAVAVYGRTGRPCYHCGTPIRRIVVGGRSTHFCPTCQK